MKRHFFTKTYFQSVRLLGLAFIFMSILDVRYDFLNDYLKGFSIAFGIGIVLVSTLLLSNKSYMKQQKIAEQDERLVMIRHKVVSKTYIVHYWIQFALIVIFGMFKSTNLISIIMALIFMVGAIFMVSLDYYYKRKY